jgi:hypothetical protein
MPSHNKKANKQPEVSKPDFVVSGNEVIDIPEATGTAVEPLQEQLQQQQPPPRITDEALKSHEDLLTKARQDRAQAEAEKRLNIIHEMEMQIKSQQSREPDRPLKDGKGKTWEDYHDIFWQAKRGVIYKDDPEGLNKYLAGLLGQEREIAWMDEK